MKRKVAGEYKKKSRDELQVTGPPGPLQSLGAQGKVGCGGIHMFSFHTKSHLPKPPALMTGVNNTV